MKTATEYLDSNKIWREVSKDNPSKKALYAFAAEYDFFNPISCPCSEPTIKEPFLEDGGRDWCTCCGRVINNDQ